MERLFKFVLFGEKNLLFFYFSLRNFLLWGLDLVNWLHPLNGLLL